MRLLVAIFSVHLSCQKDQSIIAPPDDLRLSGKIVFQSLDSDPRHLVSDALWSIDVSNPSQPMTQLSPGRHVFRVSPDGRFIAFIRIPASYQHINTWEIHTMAIEGTQDTIVKQILCFQLHSIDWSPDSKQLVFDCYLSSTGAWAIFIMNRDGSNCRAITDTTKNFSYASTPEWAPTRGQIAYLYRSPVFPISDSLGIMASDGTGQHRIAKGNSGSTPRWSPDGNRIAFAGSNPYYGGLSIADLASGSATPVTPPTGQVLYAYSLNWLTDGRLLCVAMNLSDSTYGINVVPSNASSGVERIASDFRASEPLYSSPSITYSAEGQTIFVLGQRGTDGFSLYAMRNDGSGLRQIVQLSSSSTASAIPGQCWWVP